MHLMLPRLTSLKKAGNEFVFRLHFLPQAIRVAVQYLTATHKASALGQVVIVLAPTLVPPCNKPPHLRLLNGRLLVHLMLVQRL